MTTTTTLASQAPFVFNHPSVHNGTSLTAALLIATACFAVGLALGATVGYLTRAAGRAR